MKNKHKKAGVKLISLAVALFMVVGLVAAQLPSILPISPVTVSVIFQQWLATYVEARFYDGDNSHYVALASPTTVAANITFTLPAADGTANQLLKTDGALALGWTSLTGTANQVTVTPGASSITLSLPQSIAAASSPTFTGLTLSGLNTAGGIVQTDGSGVLSTSVDLPTATTIGTKYAYRADGTDVAVADGGTNIGSYAVGDLLYASTTGVLSKLADVAVGSVLVSGGVNTAPAYSEAPTLTSVTIGTALISNPATDNIGIGGPFPAGMTGDNNNHVGARSHEAITSGWSNNAFGYHAQRGLTTGAGNNAFGDRAQVSLTTADGNTAVGDMVQYALIASTGNTGVGFVSQYKTINGIGNTAIGSATQYEMLGGDYNCAFGFDSQKNLTTGDGNTAIGKSVQNAIGAGSYNIGIGYECQYVLTGNGNIGMGTQTHHDTTTGSENVSIGYSSQHKITSGNYNIALGSYAAYGTVTTNAPATDTYGILIGHLANRSVATANTLTNYIGIGYGALIDKSNQVKIGNSSITETILFGDLGLSGNLSRKYTVTTDNTNGADTYTAAEMMGGLILRGTDNAITAAVVDVTATAAAIVAAIPGCIVGSGFEFRVSNRDATHTVSVDGGVGVTMSPNDPSTVIPAGSTGTLLVVVTNATAASEAVTIHCLGIVGH